VGVGLRSELSGFDGVRCISVSIVFCYLDRTDPIDGSAEVTILTCETTRVSWSSYICSRHPRRLLPRLPDAALLPNHSGCGCSNVRFRNKCHNALFLWITPLQKAVARYELMAIDYCRAYRLCSTLNQRSAPQKRRARGLETRPSLAFTPGCPDDYGTAVRGQSYDADGRDTRGIWAGQAAGANEGGFGFRRSEN